MKKYTILFLAFTFLTTIISAQSALEKMLFDLPGVVFKKLETPEGFEAAYELHIKQPLDHKDHSKGYIYQRAFLSHRGFNRPMVMATEGYARPRNRMYELTSMLDANQLDIEHRYFGTSVPDTLDYQYLTFEQMAEDLHHINQLFKKLYQEKWVSTGISKGGTTTIFYRYFYPNDVDVSVPYVAPVNYEYEEKRIYEFLDKVGTAECREDIKEIQVRLLQEREKVLPLLKWYAKGAKHKFTYLTLEEAFEYAVLEYPFSFWQWGHDCSKIPAADADLEVVLQNFMDVVGISFYADADMEAFASHYYQSSTQMGYYGYETAEFKGLLKALPTDSNPYASFTPNKMEVKFDGTLTNKVAKWLKTEGNNFLYINGGIDTWSATGVEKSDKVNSKWFVLEGKDHAKARIAHMTEEEKAEFEEALEMWLGVEID
ncbi:MAG: hypothetical protein ACI9XO_001808 [Paraglaciecola sp.]|jgi:hypothetical protein